MKQRLQLAITLLFACVAGLWADTTLLTEADGWTKITSISQNDIADRYFVFVAADDMEYVKYWFGHLYDQHRIVVVPRTQGISTTQVIKIVNGDVVNP